LQVVQRNLPANSKSSTHWGVHARADKIRVRTGTAIADGHVVWAYLKRLDELRPSNDEISARHRHGDVVREAMQRASLRGHIVESVIRGEGARAAAACARCGARLYIDSAKKPPLLEGEVFEADCPSAHS